MLPCRIRKEHTIPVVYASSLPVRVASPIRIIPSSYALVVPQYELEAGQPVFSSNPEHSTDESSKTKLFNWLRCWLAKWHSSQQVWTRVINDPKWAVEQSLVPAGSWKRLTSEAVLTVADPVDPYIDGRERFGTGITLNSVRQGI